MLDLDLFSKNLSLAELLVKNNDLNKVFNLFDQAFKFHPLKIILLKEKFLASEFQNLPLPNYIRKLQSLD